MRRRRPGRVLREDAPAKGITCMSYKAILAVFTVVAAVVAGCSSEEPTDPTDALRARVQTPDLQPKMEEGGGSECYDVGRCVNCCEGSYCCWLCEVGGTPECSRRVNA